MGPDYEVWEIQVENGDVFPDINSIVVFENRLWQVLQLKLNDKKNVELYTVPADPFDSSKQWSKTMKGMF